MGDHLAPYSSNLSASVSKNSDLQNHLRRDFAVFELERTMVAVMRTNLTEKNLINQNPQAGIESPSRINSHGAY